MLPFVLTPRSLPSSTRGLHPFLACPGRQTGVIHHRRRQAPLAIKLAMSRQAQTSLTGYTHFQPLAVFECTVVLASDLSDYFSSRRSDSTLRRSLSCAVPGATLVNWPSEIPTLFQRVKPTI
jgi:hypothetical protein